MNYYRSGYESQIAQDLEARDVSFSFEEETFDYISTVRGGVCSACGSTKTGKKRKYTPDFIIPVTSRRLSHRPLVVEAKGRFPSTDRSKMRDVRKAHPEMDVRILFQKRSKKQAAIVATWCDKNNFDYAFGTSIPQEWLDYD